MPSAGQSMRGPAGRCTAPSELWPATTSRPLASARFTSLSSPACASADTSTSAYGVVKKSCCRASPCTVPSQACAAGLARLVLVLVQVGVPPTRYGWVISAALDSRLGSMAQVSFAATPAGLVPSASSPPSRPVLARLVASPSLSSEWQAACSGCPISGQIQAACSGRVSPADLELPGQNGRNVYAS